MTSKANTKPRVCYKLSIKQPKKQHKDQEWIKQKKALENRVKKEGMTKWLKNALDIVNKRLQKAGLLK